MSVASLVFAILAIVISLASVAYTRRQAVAAEASLALERERRLDERRPDLLGKVETVDQGGSYRLCLVEESGPPLAGMSVSIPAGQGVAFSGGVPGVFAVVSSTDVPLRAFSCDDHGNPAEMRPGQSAIWKIGFARNRDPAIPIRLTVECRGENGESWDIVLQAALHSDAGSPVFGERGLVARHCPARPQRQRGWRACTIDPVRRADGRRLPWCVTVSSGLPPEVIIRRSHDRADMARMGAAGYR